jgi:hypothetical protein
MVRYCISPPRQFASIRPGIFHSQYKSVLSRHTKLHGAEINRKFKFNCPLLSLCGPAQCMIRETTLFQAINRCTESIDCFVQRLCLRALICTCQSSKVASLLPKQISLLRLLNALISTKTIFSGE